MRLGIDHFMSTARALANITGNIVATLEVSRNEQAIGDTTYVAAAAAMRAAVL